MEKTVFVPYLQVTPNIDISTRVNALAYQITKMHLTCLGWKLPQQIKVVQKGTVTIRINSIQ